MIPADYVVCSLANLMFNEPKEDHILGMTACGLIVRNRVISGWEGGQWLKLIQNHDKYSANPPANPRVMVLGDPNHDPIFRRCLGIAESIFMGRERDITADNEGRGALWYGRLNECSDWFKENIVRQPQDHPMVATIGLQKFFR